MPHSSISCEPKKFYNIDYDDVVMTGSLVASCQQEWRKGIHSIQLRQGKRCPGTTEF